MKTSNMLSPLPSQKSTPPYEKSARKNGPASLYTALLMDKGIFKTSPPPTNKANHIIKKWPQSQLQHYVA